MPDVGLFVQLGVAGVVLYLFVTGRIVTAAAAKAHLADVGRQYEARIRGGDTAIAELRRDRDAWKHLALDAEASLTAARVTVAAAVGAPIVSDEGPAPRGAVGV